MHIKVGSFGLEQMRSEGLDQPNGSVRALTGWRRDLFGPERSLPERGFQFLGFIVFCGICLGQEP